MCLFSPFIKGKIALLSWLHSLDFVSPKDSILVSSKQKCLWSLLRARGGEERFKHILVWDICFERMVSIKVHKHVDTVVEGEGGTHWVVRIDVYTLTCVKQVASGKLLYSARGSDRCSVKTWMGVVGGRLRREGLYIYIGLIHFLVRQNLTQHRKAIICQ